MNFRRKSQRIVPKTWDMTWHASEQWFSDFMNHKLSPCENRKQLILLGLQLSSVVELFVQKCISVLEYHNVDPE
jgi:hypothetical protein